MKIDFDKLKALQYCDNSNCKGHQQIDLDNICTLSKAHNQVYCNLCNNRWVLTKDTFFYCLKTPPEKIIQVLLALSEGKGNRAIERTLGVSRITQKKWVIKAANHLNEINNFITANMELTRLQVDEFWSFILKKRESYTR
jgi:hypothetical protein